MKTDETLVQQLHLLDPLITAMDDQAVRQFDQFPYLNRVRQARITFAEYCQDLSAQVFAEIKAVLANQLTLIKEKKLRPLLLKKGRTIKNQNIRFFSETKDLTPGKYAILFEHTVTKSTYFLIADFDGQSIFQVSFKFNPIANQLVAIDGHYQGYSLLALTPFLRNFMATQQAETKLLKMIAQGDVGVYFKERGLDQINPDLLAGLDPSKQKVLSSFVGLDQGLQMLMGPPGTGKTTTIVRILKALIEQQEQMRAKKRILVCGPSNKSVHVIALAFRKKYPQHKIALYARESALDLSVSADLRDILVQDQQAALQAADIVLMTLSAAGSKFVRGALKSIDILIIDEVGQSPEPETLIPFALNPSQKLKVLLVGDVHQLPPTILSDNPSAMHHDWSMLWRLIQECQQPHFMLDTQYRMHPDISEFPKDTFYQDRVQDGVLAEDRTRTDIAPYEVLDVDGLEEIDVVTKSYKNLKEARQVVMLARFVLSKGYVLSDISIITPYKAQAQMIKEILREEDINADEMHINTVDSFQGEESAVVFVSMVRANAKARIGFLEKYQRLNVAITRPKEVLRILMNGQTFNPFHPKNEFENDFLEITKTFYSIPLPRDENAKLTFDVMSQRQGHAYSAVGYRRSLKDYEESMYNNYYLYDDDYYYGCSDDDVSPVTYFEGPSQMQRFIEMLNHYQGYFSSCIGKFPIFFLPYITKGTHVVQDILDRIKHWRRLSFVGLPDDFFEAVSYKNYYKSVSEVEDYGGDFEYEDYARGYAIGYIDEQDENMDSMPLLFEGHAFFYCDLRNINFHNSTFKNTLFEGSDVRGCNINLEQMDEISRASFLEALASNRFEELPREMLPTEKLIRNAMERRVYQKSDVDHRAPTFFQGNQVRNNSQNAEHVPAVDVAGSFEYLRNRK